MDLFNDLERDLAFLRNVRTVVSFVFGLQEYFVTFVANVIFRAWPSTHQNIVGGRAEDAPVLHFVPINCVFPLLAVRDKAFVIGIFYHSR